MAGGCSGDRVTDKNIRTGALLGAGAGLIASQVSLGGTGGLALGGAALGALGGYYADKALRDENGHGQTLPSGEEVIVLDQACCPVPKRDMIVDRSNVNRVQYRRWDWSEPEARTSYYPRYRAYREDPGPLW